MISHFIFHFLAVSFIACQTGEEDRGGGTIFRCFWESEGSLIENPPTVTRLLAAVLRGGYNTEQNREGTCFLI